MNGIDAVRAYFVGHIDGCAVAPFTDALTHVHGTVGFKVLVGESVRTVEVAYELLEPEEAVVLEEYLDHVGLIELMRAIEEAAILVTPSGAHRIEGHGPRGHASGAVAILELTEPGPFPAATTAATPAATESIALRAYLIVEDDLDVAEIVEAYLRALGGMVCRVSRIDEAERILADLRVDGIVVDIRLPDGDGLDWLAKLVRSERGFSGRMLVCSGEALPDHRLDELERSGAVFLEKPFELGALAQALGIDGEPLPPEPGSRKSDA